MSIANLTKLREIDLGHNKITGLLNPGLWQLPDLESVAIDETGLEIRFPAAQISPKLRHVFVPLPAATAGIDVF